MDYRVSSFCSGGGCVEVARQAGRVCVRGTNSRELVSTFTDTEWRALVADIKAGKLDLERLPTA